MVTFFSDMTNSDGMNSFANQANLYRDPEEVVAYQLRTMETLKEVLSPTQVKDKNGNMIDTYFLATTLYDKRGNPTNYISPASFFKISILTGELIIRRQIDYMTVKYGEIRDECVAAGWVKKDMADVIATFQVYFNLSNLLNLLLCFICMVAVIFCAIFAMIQYMMTMFEYAIVTSIVIFYVPFYLADISKSIASKLFPIFWNFFIKLMVVTILMWFAIYQYINLASDQVSMAIPFSPTVFATTMFTILLSFIVTQNGPKVAQTIISGNPELSMGEFLQAGGTMLAGGAVMGKPVQAGARAAAGGAAKAIGAGFASRAEAKAEDKGVLGQMTSFVGGSIRQGTASILRTPFSIAGSVASKVLFGGKSPDLAGKMAEGFTNTMSLHTGNASGEDGGGKESSSFDNKASGEKKENASKFNGNSSQGASPSSKAPGGVSNAAKFKSRKSKSRKSKSRKKRRRR